jgi:DNA-binding PadR family transcriptional regulator
MIVYRKYPILDETYRGDGMSLKHAILGFLNYEPSTGYELKKNFDTTVQNFWPADQSQIYRTLAWLNEQGWVSMEVVPQEDHPDRKVYSITVAGRDELLQWLTTPLKRAELRSASLIQVFFAGQLTDDQILEMFEREAVYLRSILKPVETVPEIENPIVNPTGSPRDQYFWMLTMENGIKIAYSQLEWIESVIDRIKNKEIPNK